MLTPTEKRIFVILALLSAFLAWRGIHRIWRIIQRGGGEFRLDGLGERLREALVKSVTQKTVFRSRRQVSLAHAFVAWGFLFYLLVNIGDVLRGFVPGFTLLSEGTLSGPYRLLADVLSVGVLLSMTYLLLRRFARKPTELEIIHKALVHPKARAGIRRDSAIVGAFILTHVGARFLGESLEIAQTGSDGWRPFASGVGRLWSNGNVEALVVGEHIAWWLALGLILVFIPYFPYTKHIHIFFAPLNFMLKPRRPTPGQMDPLSLDNEKLGADRLEDLPWAGLMDAYACIQCNRCQDVCPASAAGSTLSPSALEINKRYQINQESATLAAGKPSSLRLTEFAIGEEAVWSCTSCAACVEICPVGNEPMRDILNIRRNLTLEQGKLPERGANMLRHMAVTGNPWGAAPSQRMAWAEGLGVRTMQETGKADVLYWVGCSSAYDARNQSIARAVVRLLQKAGVDFAILGNEEGCTGDPARRLGEEALFQKLVRRNFRILSRYSFHRIVTHCSHCFQALKNEYLPLISSLVGNDLSRWEVLHHTQLLNELRMAGRLAPRREIKEIVTYHDSCYLGRYNNEFDAPRELLNAVPGLQLKEMPRSRENGLCCGGGGGCAWVDMPAERRVTDIRLEEALSLKPAIVATACPFCMTMFEGSTMKAKAGVQLRDVAELLEESMPKEE